MDIKRPIPRRVHLCGKTISTVWLELHYLDCRPRATRFCFFTANPTWSVLLEKRPPIWNRTGAVSRPTHWASESSASPRHRVQDIDQIVHREFEVQRTSEKITLVIHDWGSACRTQLAGDFPSAFVRVAFCEFHGQATGDA